MKASPAQVNFGGGEWSRLAQGRIDNDLYRSALATCLNFVPFVQGGVTRRPGTRYVAAVKDSTKATRLVAFQFSTTQAYVIEFGDQYIRFYRNNEQIEVLSVPYEISTPYLEADLFDLKFTQSADVLYVTHPSYAPRKIERSGHTSWTVTEIDFQDGPYLPVNTTATTMTPSGTTGSITITASSATGINGGAGFASTDVGRLIRIKHSSTWGWAKITAVTHTTLVTATVNSTLGGTGAVTDWRLGVWSDTTGFPACSTFHEDRLCFSGATDYPDRLDMSNSGDYENFAPSDTSGTIADSNAVNATLNANEVNAVRTMVSHRQGIQVFTAGAEWVVRGANSQEAISPTNIDAKQYTSYGAANVEALPAGHTTLFLQSAAKKLREFQYAFEIDGFEAPNLAVMAEHITCPAIIEFDQMREPQPVVWLVRSDGALIGLTYEREAGTLRAGWHRHILGGQSDAAGTQAKVESLAVIPAPDGTRDELWLLVNRRINGATVRYVEYVEKFYSDEDAQEDRFYVDCGLTRDPTAVVITGITAANPPVVTCATPHGLSNEDDILISGVVGMTEVNGLSYFVANVTSTTFELQVEVGTDVDGTGYSAYVSGGEVKTKIDTVTGLSHLEGETVDILGDGIPQIQKTVSSGQITLASSAAVVHVGLPRSDVLKLLRPEAGAGDGVALGKLRRVSNYSLLLEESGGFKHRVTQTDYDEVSFRDADDIPTIAVPLKTGIAEFQPEAVNDYDNQLEILIDKPTPFTLLAVAVQVFTEDR